MATFDITIDGMKIKAEEGDSVLLAASKAGIEIPNLCFMKNLEPYGACGVCVVEVKGVAKLLRACSTKVFEGMEVSTRSERSLKARKLAMELMMGDHDADCLGPCKLECPAHTDCQKYVKEIAQGRYADAVATVKETFPFPSSIGRVCPHPCESACRRRHVEESVSIAALKAFAGDIVREKGLGIKPSCAPLTHKRVSIIGGGPAGLSAAYRLARKGHEVTVFDQMPEMGGMLRYGIPEYRLPKAVLRSEIEEISALGVKFVNNFKVGRDSTIEKLREECDAMIIASGAWKSSSMGIEGEKLEGVFGGIDFLRAVSLGQKPLIGERVAIVGGGNTAMDACRTAVRLGAKEVYVIYRRTRSEMPAEEIEISEAEEEGVVFKFLRSPLSITAQGDRVGAIHLQVMRLDGTDERGRPRPVAIEGEVETIALDSVIIAIGQTNDIDGFESLTLTKRGTIEASGKDFSTSLEGVFACGDAVNRGAGIAIEAIAEANEAANAVDAYLKGEAYSQERSIVSVRTVTEKDFENYPKSARAKNLVRPSRERRGDFGEVARVLDEETARSEAKRCLECGCHDYSECRLIHYAKKLKTDVARLKGEYHPGFVEEKLLSIERNQRKCITCNLCVRVCESVAKKGVLGLVDRGFATVIKPEFDNDEILSFCKDCHECVNACPTGALRLIDR
jgi:formate dehydrogenase major subunit